MSRLPIIAGFGGVNPAGRVSFNHAYRRMVIDALGANDQARTYRSLTSLMNLAKDPDDSPTRAHIDQHTLIRRIESFDPDAVAVQGRAALSPAGESPITFIIGKRQLC